MTAIAQAPVQCLKRTASAVLFLLALAACLTAQAQNHIDRCGQAYTNVPRDARGCERLPDHAVTVVKGTWPAPRPSHTSASSPGGSSGAAAAKTGAATRNTWPNDLASALPASEAAWRSQQAVRDAQARDAQARAVLRHELDNAQAQLAQLRVTFNQGEPAKWASESRNHQKYLDRVAGLKAAIARSEDDIDRLQRELVRPPVLAQQRTP